MKRAIKVILSVLVLSALLVFVSACNSSSHTHKWGSWYDNGDGTHIRMCLSDSDHIESAPHIFSDYEITKEPTDILPGEQIRVCSLCGYTEKETVEPTGDHVFDKEIADDKYLYSKESAYCAIYYKSCDCGAFGNPDCLFEKSLLPEGYTDLKYIKGNGSQYIDTEIGNDEAHFISYNNIGEFNNLPDGYQRVDYIESTGTQYIDTGLPTKDGYSYDITYMYTALEKDDVDILSATGMENGVYIQSVLINYCYKANRTIVNDQQTLSESPVAGEIYNSVMSFNGRSFTHYINGVLAHKSTIIPYTNVENLYLFARNSVGNVSSFSKARVYYYKVYGEDDVLIQNMVPCYEKTSGKAGFYDTVSGTFYTNLGFGDFIAGTDGADEENLFSNGYLADFTYSDGKYVNFYTDELTVFDFQIQTFNETSYIKDVYDEIITENGTYNICIDKSKFSPDTTRLRLKHNGSVRDVTVAYLPVDVNYSYSVTFTVYSCDPTTIGGLSMGNIEISSDYVNYKGQNLSDSLCVGFNYYGPNPSYNYSRIYDAYVYENDQLLLQLIPALRNSDSKVGMYDLKNGKFYETVSDAQFASGGVACHILGDGEMVEESTYCTDGTRCYACRICGTKIYDKVPKRAYKVTFDADDGVKAVRIYSGPDMGKYDISNVAYSRNAASYNYSKTGAVVLFSVELKDGYELDSYEPDDEIAIDKLADYVLVSGFTKDITIKIKTKVSD